MKIEKTESQLNYEINSLLHGIQMSKKNYLESLKICEKNLENEILNYENRIEKVKLKKQKLKDLEVIEQKLNESFPGLGLDIDLETLNYTFTSENVIKTADVFLDLRSFVFNIWTSASGYIGVDVKLPVVKQCVKIDDNEVIISCNQLDVINEKNRLQSTNLDNAIKIDTNQHSSWRSTPMTKRKVCFVNPAELIKDSLTEKKFEKLNKSVSIRFATFMKNLAHQMADFEYKYKKNKNAVSLNMMGYFDNQSFMYKELEEEYHRYKSLKMFI